MPPQTIDKQIFNRLTKLYLMALLAVGLLSLGGQLVIQLFLKDILGDSHIVNMAGRQRMLSQKISKSVLLLLQPEINENYAKKIKNELDQDLETWAENHRGLKNGQLVSEKKIFFKNSEKIDSLFGKLEPVFSTIFNNTNKIIRKKLDQAQFKIAKNEIINNEPTFLKTMIEIVAQYDKEAAKRVDIMQKIEGTLFCLLLMVLLLEGFFIFKPIANNIQKVVQKLANSESNLIEANAQLSATNLALTNTKNELLVATEEKYKLQMAEEKVRSASLIEGQELERKRLALELHDGIGQMLTGLRLQSEHLKNSKFINQKAEKSFQELQNLVVETIEATRSISFNLAPSVLADFGILSAIKLLIEKNFTGSKIKVEINSNFNKRLPEKIEIGLYRIVQEGINNILKHANASKITIELFEKDHTLYLEIKDNGIGFDLLKKSEGSGINNMQTRAKFINADFSINPEPKMGVKIKVEVPN